MKKEKDKREIELYIATLFDLKYIDYKYILDYSSIEIKEKSAIVQLYESHEVVFEATAPDVSKLGHLPHTFTLHNQDGKWVIYKDEYQDELSRQFVDMTKDEIKNQVDENYRMSNQASQADTNVEVSPSHDLLARSLGLVAYSYNRTAARNYADTYWSNYNTTWYATYPGNDCTNFVSQSIYAGQGKTPPNESGMQPAPRNINTDWYYVWNNSGSTPWVQVAAQYTFMNNNRINQNKVGPYGTSVALCGMKVGDVVQLKDANNVWFHEGIVAISPYPACPGNALSIYQVNAHTTDRYHYPLSNWASYPMRYINIMGWYGN